MISQRCVTCAIVSSLLAIVCLAAALLMRAEKHRKEHLMEAPTVKDVLAEANKLMAAGKYKEARDKFIVAVNSCDCDGDKVTALAAAAECSYRYGETLEGVFRENEDKFTLELCERLKPFKSGRATHFRIGGAVHWRAGRHEKGRAEITTASHMGDPEAALMLTVINGS